MSSIGFTVGRAFNHATGVVNGSRLALLVIRRSRIGGSRSTRGRLKDSRFDNLSCSKSKSRVGVEKMDYQFGV